MKTLVTVVLVALTILGVLFGAGRSVGGLIVAASLERPVSEWLLPILGLLGTALGGLASAFVLRRIGGDSRAVVAGMFLAIASFGTAWSVWIDAQPPSGGPTELKSLTPMPASATFPETDARRPKVTYRTNSLGFRGPDWRKRAEGERLVLVLGDSFVFGMGVEDDATLPVQLAREVERLGRKDVTVVNLGVPGGNLRTHVDVLEAALALGFRPDVVLACITSNDFEGWNPDEARQARRTFGGYSLATFVLGESAGPWLRASLFGLSTTASAQERMRVEELQRLTTVARSVGFALEVFAFTPSDRDKLVPPLDAGIVSTLAELQELYFIPNDGHPTPEGNVVFAKHLAGRIAARLR